MLLFSPSPVQHRHLVTRDAYYNCNRTSLSEVQTAQPPMADLLAQQLTVMREVSQQLAALLEMLLRVTVAGPVPAAAPAAAPARTVALLRVATSLPSTQPSTASAATPSAGPAPIPCQLSSSALEPSEILLPDEANSNTEETPAPQQETLVVARRRQSVRTTKSWRWQLGSMGLPEIFWTADISSQKLTMLNLRRNINGRFYLRA
ncbi:uncharacterized protein ACIQIH_000499 isoform 1-T3 [Cyanocitta cristata]